MGLKNLSRQIRHRKSIKGDNLIHPNKATIYADDGFINLDINGVPHSITIYYKGEIYLNNHLSAYYRVRYSQHKLMILNLFRKKLPKYLLDYQGYMEIIDCDVSTYNGDIFKATIKRENVEILLNNQKTKLEDDSIILREESSMINKQIGKAGFQKARINPNIVGAGGKYQKLEKLDLSQIASSMDDMSIREKPIRQRGISRPHRQRPAQKQAAVVKKDIKRGGKY